MFQLEHLPPGDLPASFAPNAVALLEREAELAARDTSVEGGDGEGGEGYGEYLISLVDAVLRLEDPRSLRGMALLGIQTSRKVKEFVASQGATALPYLDEAWESVPLARSDVVATWAYMFGVYGDRLSREARLEVMARVFASLHDDPTHVISISRIASLPEAVPLLERIAAESPHDISRALAERLLMRLRPLRDRTAPVDLMARLADWLDAICLAARSGAKRGACESLENLLADATEQVEEGRIQAAKNVLKAFVQRADQAQMVGALTEAEHRLLAGNVRYLFVRL